MKIFTVSRRHFLFFAVPLFFFSSICWAQDNKTLALEKAKEAIKLVDDGKYEDGISLLKEAQQLDPNNYNYPYEIGYTYYVQNKLLPALDKFKEAAAFKINNAQCYQMLGNVYSDLNDSANAFQSYNQGLEHFPHAGIIYLEKGNFFYSKKQYLEALSYYEKGIEMDPEFPSNYFYATKIFCASSERIWGVIYGEIFMNLERGSKRASEISELLYKTYQSAIKINDNQSAAISFSKIISLNNKKKELLPFSTTFEMLMTLSVTPLILSGETDFSLGFMSKIRNNFISNWVEKNHYKDYPNILFDFHQLLLKDGYLEAYTHWILRKGNESEFEQWKNASKEKWTAFINWFDKNHLHPTGAYHFYRKQYE